MTPNRKVRRNGFQRALETRRRASSQDHGFIGITILGIILVLGIVSLNLFSNTKTVVVNAATNRDFILSQENLDSALNQASYWLSRNAAMVPSGTGRLNSTERPSTWNWGFTPEPGEVLTPGVSAAGAIDAVGIAGDSVQGQVREYRSRWVGTVTDNPDASGTPLYRVSSDGAWSSPLAFEGLGRIRGVVNGDVSIYGSGKADITGTVARVIAYDDTAEAEQSTYTFQRSALTAHLDRHLLNQKLNAAIAIGGGSAQWGNNCRQRWNPRAFTGGVAAPAVGATRCYYETLFNQPLTINGPGIATVLSLGKVEFRSPITLTNGAQLHIYTPSGTVRFITDRATTIGAHIFAPRARCTTSVDTGSLSGTDELILNGALTCGDVRWGGTLNYVKPLFQSVGTGVPTSYIRYLEAPGYVDHLNQ